MRRPFLLVGSLFIKVCIFCPGYCGHGILWEEQERLGFFNVVIAALIPRKQALLIGPEALKQRERIVFIEPKRVPHIITVMVSMNFPESAQVWVLKDIGIVLIAFVVLSGFDLGSGNIDHTHGRLKGQSKQNHLRMSKRVEESDCERPIWTFFVRLGKNARYVPTKVLNVVQYLYIRRRQVIRRVKRSRHLAYEDTLSLKGQILGMSSGRSVKEIVRCLYR